MTKAPWPRRGSGGQMHGGGGHRTGGRECEWPKLFRRMTRGQEEGGRVSREVRHRPPDGTGADVVQEGCGASASTPPPNASQSRVLMPCSRGAGPAHGPVLAGHVEAAATRAVSKGPLRHRRRQGWARSGRGCHRRRIRERGACRKACTPCCGNVWCRTRVCRPPRGVYNAITTTVRHPRRPRSKGPRRRQSRGHGQSSVALQGRGNGGHLYTCSPQARERQRR